MTKLVFKPKFGDAERTAIKKAQAYLKSAEQFLVPCSRQIRGLGEKELRNELTAIGVTSGDLVYSFVVYLSR